MEVLRELIERYVKDHSLEILNLVDDHQDDDDVNEIIVILLNIVQFMKGILYVIWQIQDVLT
jgi:hypothetical protein